MDQIADFNKIAGFMTLDSDLWIANRYERLQLINLLAIQQRLSNLEHEINDVVKYERSLITGETCIPPEKSSATLLNDLEKTMKAYGKMTILLLYCGPNVSVGDAISILGMIKGIESPAEHTVQSLKSFAPCSTVTTAFNPRWATGDMSSHLFSIAIGERGWFHKLIGKHERLSRVFQEVSNPRYFSLSIQLSLELTMPCRNTKERINIFRSIQKRNSKTRNSEWLLRAFAWYSFCQF